MMCTSGSRQVGSWICATDAGPRTATGMDCVIVVSRSWNSASRAADGSANSSSSWRGLRGGGLWRGWAALVVEKLVVIGGAREESVFVVMVRERRG